MAKVSRKKEKSAAVVTVFGPGKMMPRGRRDIANWMIVTALRLISQGKNYTTGRFTARYLYR
jgi:hypothetical protein